MPPVMTPAPRCGLQAGALVIGYVTGPRAGRSDEHPPERDIERACERSGWQLAEVVRDREDGSILERPALTGALERIVAGQAHGLVVNDARLLGRSVDFAKFVQWFRDAEAALIALDLGLDTSTPEGSRVASSLITLNGWAGEWIASRTRHSLADIRPNGGADGRLAISERPEVLERIAGMHEAGMAPQEIADELNDEARADAVRHPEMVALQCPDRPALLARGVRGQARATAVTGEERDWLILPVGSPRHRHPARAWARAG